MYLRQAPTTTLEELRETMPRPALGVDVQARNIQVSLAENPRIILSDEVDVPVTETGLQALGNWLNVPFSFLKRVEADLQQHILNTMLSRSASVARVYYDSDAGVSLVRDPNLKFIEPHRIVGATARVLGPQALVVEHWQNTDDFRLDVIVPEGSPAGVGGDPRVGDITRGGLRIGMDIKHNLAPWVSEFMYRLVCTNGMERMDETLKVDARGSTVEEVLAEFEMVADRAFRRVESTIAAFYDLRDQRVDNPERTILRMGEEQGLPARTLLTLAERVPSLGDDPSMFDIVNLITNQANEPSTRRRANSSRALELAGGAVVADHADRCGHCQSRLN